METTVATENLRKGTVIRHRGVDLTVTKREKWNGKRYKVWVNVAPLSGKTFRECNDLDITAFPSPMAGQTMESLVSHLDYGFIWATVGAAWEVVS